MKKVALFGLPLLLVAALVFGVLPAIAGKPQKAIEMSNGMPSGDHQNLLFHGKDASVFNCIECDPSIEGCNVVNIHEYGTAPITYVSGRKVNIPGLTVFDSCAGFDGPDDSAEIWIPYEPEGYYVYARALGKPAKKDSLSEGYQPRSIIFQNTENSPSIYSLFGEVTEPGDVELMLPLGLIASNGDFIYDSSVEGGNLVRFDSQPDGKGRGKSQGKDITNMFMWTGCVYQPILDTNEDGVVDENDVPSSYDTDGTLGISSEEFQSWLNDNPEGYVYPESFDMNGDGEVNEMDVEHCCLGTYDTDSSGIIESDEFVVWVNDNLPSGTTIEDLLVPLWACYDNPVWVFSIADLVYQNQVVINNGIKNLQLRFYPVATTTFD
jgi:hypothetical protein